MAMRLTLRVLLAYMHGILSEADAAEMDKKVAESEFAQKLITHIRTRVMRKELSALAVEGDGIGRDANTVAEYLDHKLDPQQVAQLELLCFESDRHLAEVASSHQILTMVLGTPAHVSSSLRKRVYGQLGNSMLLKTDSSTDLNAVLTPDDQRWSTSDDVPPDVEEDDRHLATAELPIAQVIPDEEEEDEDFEDAELATSSSGAFGRKGWSMALVVVLALATGWLIAASGWIAPPQWLTGRTDSDVALANDKIGDSTAEVPAEQTTPNQLSASGISRDKVNTLDDIPFQPGAGTGPNTTNPDASTPTSQQIAANPGSPPAMSQPALANPRDANPDPTRTAEADMPFSNVPTSPPEGENQEPANPESIDPSLLEPGRRGVFLIHDITSGQFIAPPQGAVLRPFQRLIVGPGGYFATTAEDAGELIVVGPADMLLTADGRVMLNYGQISIPASERAITIEVVGGLSATFKNIAEGGEANIEVDRYMTADMPPISQGWMKIYSAGQCEVVVGDVSLPLLPADELIMRTDNPPILNHRKQAPSWSVLYPSPAADFVRLKLTEGATQGIEPLAMLQRVAESNASPGVRSEAMRIAAAAGKFGPLVASFHDPTLSQFWSAHFQDLAESWARVEPNEKPELEAAVRSLSPQFGDALIGMLDKYWREELTKPEAVELILNLGHHETAVRLFAFESLERMAGYTLLYRPDMSEAEREGPITRWWGRFNAGQLSGLTATRTPK
ncbi:hypothetical protein [Blastopirellula marina]|uniref:Uncharacterized protein n=1 Tax=Blastopirellula marina DSM 3645 TaxID=314230 RepID=A3ZLA6_9BACT|nr:hypothetical protein [Blastopirellula marina]EAQ82539.1 hypothetical protein DSM3645_09077 [Blastopirellula marina DSM 3645]